MAENLLAIDNGTQSVHALLFDPRGKLIAKQRVPIEPYYSDAPGLAEQKPQVFWNAVCHACQGLWQQPGVLKDSIAAVALTTQRATVISVDRNGEPLRPAIIFPRGSNSNARTLWVPLSIASKFSAIFLLRD